MKLNPIVRIFLFAAIAALTTAPLVAIANNPTPPAVDGCSSDLAP